MYKLYWFIKHGEICQAFISCNVEDYDLLIKKKKKNLTQKIMIVKI